MEAPGRFRRSDPATTKGQGLQAARLANNNGAWKCCVRGQYAPGGSPSDPFKAYANEPA